MGGRRVEDGEDALLLVVGGDRDGLRVVGGEALAKSGFVVVGAVDEGLSGDVVLAGDLRGVESAVVHATRRGVHQTASRALVQELVIDGKLQRAVESSLLGAEHAVELFNKSNILHRIISRS